MNGYSYQPQIEEGVSGKQKFKFKSLKKILLFCGGEKSYDSDTEVIHNPQTSQIIVRQRNASTGVLIRRQSLKDSSLKDDNDNTQFLRNSSRNSRRSNGHHNKYGSRERKLENISRTTDKQQQQISISRISSSNTPLMTDKTGAEVQNGWATKLDPERATVGIRRNSVPTFYDENPLRKARSASQLSQYASCLSFTSSESSKHSATLEINSRQKLIRQQQSYQNDGYASQESFEQPDKHRLAAKYQNGHNTEDSGESKGYGDARKDNSKSKNLVINIKPPPSFVSKLKLCDSVFDSKNKPHHIISMNWTEL